MDIKEAVQAAAPRFSEAQMPRDNAQRVVEGACHLSPFLEERMMPANKVRLMFWEQESECSCGCPIACPERAVGE